MSGYILLGVRVALVATRDGPQKKNATRNNARRRHRPALGAASSRPRLRAYTWTEWHVRVHSWTTAFRAACRRGAHGTNESAKLSRRRAVSDAAANKPNAQSLKPLLTR